MEKQMENVKILEIKMVALAGSEIGYCIKDAIELAAKELVNVCLVHSGREYLIDIENIIKSIAEVDKAKK